MKPSGVKKATRAIRKNRVGILTCSNTTRALDCPVSACLKDMHERKGAFARYRSQDVELVGVISCPGCPTLKGEAIVLPRVEALLHYGANRIHVAYCMLTLCPFAKKYVKAIKERYPSFDLVEGTHEPHQTNIKFRCAVARMLKERRKTIIP